MKILPHSRLMMVGISAIGLVLAFTMVVEADSEDSANDRKESIASAGELAESQQVDDGPDLTDAEAEAVAWAAAFQEIDRNDEDVPAPFKYGIIEIDGSVTEVLTVYLGKGVRETDVRALPEFRSLSEAAQAKFEFVETQLDAKRFAQAWLKLASTDWREAGSETTASFGVNARDGVIVVRIDESASEAELIALRSIDSEIIRVEAGETLFRATDRHNDVSPHWGAAQLKRINHTWHCSSGFSVVGRTTGTKYSLTAGHCGSNGESLHSGSNFYGDVAGKSGFPSRDMARLRGSSYRNSIWTDGADVYNWRTVVGANNGSLGQKLCISGAKSKSRCHVEIVDQNVSVVFPDGTTNNLMILQRYTGTAPACQGGDSGGVSYHRNPENRRANVKGIIVGTNGSNRCFIHKYSTIQSHLNVNVLTN